MASRTIHLYFLFAKILNQIIVALLINASMNSKRLKLVTFSTVINGNF